MTRAEIIRLIVAKAREHRVEPVELLGGAIAESGLDPSAWRQGVWPDQSAGLFQQTVKFANEGDGTASAENIATIQRLYFDPAHACDVAAAKYREWRYDPPVSPLLAWCAYNLPASYRLWPNVPNVEQRENYRAGLAEAQRILGALPVPTYNLALPITVQDHDWDCAQESTLWAITAAGRRPDDGWMERQMLADGIESTEDGLVIGTGSKLAEWITAQYSDPSEGTPTLRAHNASPVSFDDVRSVAGSSPVLMGGHNWGGPRLGHWTGVRGYDADRDTLLLANPGGSGPLYGQQSLTRQQFAARGPWSMVVVTADGVEQPPAPPVAAPITQRDLAPLLATVQALYDRAPVG